MVGAVRGRPLLGRLGDRDHPGGATDGHRSLIPIMRDIVPLFQAIEFDDPDTLVGTPMSG